MNAIDAAVNHVLYGAPIVKGRYRVELKEEVYRDPEERFIKSLQSQEAKEYADSYAEYWDKTESYFI